MHPEFCATLSLNLKHESAWEHLQADMPWLSQSEVPMGKVK